MTPLKPEELRGHPVHLRGTADWLVGIYEGRDPRDTVSEDLLTAAKSLRAAADEIERLTERAGSLVSPAEAAPMKGQSGGSELLSRSRDA